MALYTPLIDGDCLPMCNTDGYLNVYTRQALVLEILISLIMILSPSAESIPPGNRNVMVGEPHICLHDKPIRARYYRSCEDSNQ